MIFLSATYSLNNHFLDLTLSSAFRIPKIVKFLVTIYGSWSTYGKGPPVHLCGTKPGEEIGDDFVECHLLANQ